MKRIMQASLAAGGLLALTAGSFMLARPAVAASANVEAAIKSLAKIEADPTKFQAFCKFMKDMDDVPEGDTAKAEALETQLDALLKSMGADVAQAWDLGDDLDPQSEDGKAYDLAMEAIEEKCPD
jgi:hypothetical protein